MTRESKFRDRFLVFAAAFLFSTGGAAIKSSTLNAWQVAGFRSLIAAAMISAAIPGARRNWTWRTGAVGVAYAATLILFVAANKLTTSANAIFLQSTAPLYLLFLGPLFLRERARKSDVAVFGAIAAGIALLLYGSRGSSLNSSSGIGIGLAAASGFTWAWTLTGLRWLGKHDPAGDAATSTVIAGNLIAFAISAPFVFPVLRIAPGDVIVILYLGIFQVGLAYLCLTRSIRRLPVVEAAVLLLVEPVFNPIWTWLVHHERPTTPGLIGGVIIITFAFLRTYLEA